jgi:hypothetical protein
MKSIILLTSIVTMLNVTYAQQVTNETNLSSLTKVYFGFQGIGLTYEPRISNKLTLDISGGIGGGYDIAEGYIN